MSLGRMGWGRTSPSIETHRSQQQRNDQPEPAATDSYGLIPAPCLSFPRAADVLSSRAGALRETMRRRKIPNGIPGAGTEGSLPDDPSRQADNHSQADPFHPPQFAYLSLIFPPLFFFYIIYYLIYTYYYILLYYIKKIISD